MDLCTLCCRIRTARSLLGLVGAYPCGFFIWMDFFIFYPCGSYLDGFLQKWPTPAVIIRALKCLVMLLSGWDFLCLTPDVIILAVVLQMIPVLLLFRPCAQSSSVEYTTLQPLLLRLSVLTLRCLSHCYCTPFRDGACPHGDWWLSYPHPLLLHRGKP